MRWFGALLTRVRASWRGERIYDEINEEMQFHIEMRTQENIRRGLQADDARMAAARSFGQVQRIAEMGYGVRGGGWLEALLQEMRVAARSLMRAKGLAITVVVTLALGIGANAAIFSVVRGVLLRPLANRGENRLLYIRQSAPGINTENTTFSVAEIKDLKSRATTIGEFGDFSSIAETLLDVGEPRLVHAGVVGGAFFEVMGLRPVLGRLLNSSDDGPKAMGAVVLTHRFWTNVYNSDPNVVGKPIRLRSRVSTIVGVLEPSVPYPANTDIIANMVTSPHHMSATMQDDRTHRMTELFGLLKPNVSLEAARSELTSAFAAMVQEHPEAYALRANHQLNVKPLRDQITAPARTILLVLLAAAGIVFVIACSNVANLILARSVRRESELAVRAALGAGHGALRRTLLAESLVLCGAGAILGVALARPFLSVVVSYAARFSVRALDVTVDSTIVWVGAILAMAAAVLLAYVPRLPSANAANGFGLTSGSVRITSGTNRRLRVFATTQIAFSFVLLAAAGMLVAALIALQATNAGFDTRQVLALNLPLVPDRNPDAKGPQKDLYQELMQRVAELPGVDRVVGGTFVPWRDNGTSTRYQFSVDGYTPAAGEDNPYARRRYVGPGFFATLAIPVIAGREFTEDDRHRSERIVVVSQSLAQMFFPNGDALNRRLWFTGGLTDYNVKPDPYRIVGIASDMNDESVVRTPAMMVYSPLRSTGERLFVRTSGDPYALVQSVTRVIRELLPNQVVERAATLEDIRAEVLTPERLNAFVVTGFAGIALLIAVVGVSGVLAFSVTARTREFGVRLAVGSTPRHLLMQVLLEGASIVAVGIGIGVAGGYALSTVAARYFNNVGFPGTFPILAAAIILGVAAVIASLMPAVRAARVDVLQALRSE